jgi:uncharacterized lipoprotein YbaY/heat shock protein HslJ/uncharacterized lipoprotein NlpE involved in copper resistance
VINYYKIYQLSKVTKQEKGIIMNLSFNKTTPILTCFALAFLSGCASNASQTTDSITITGKAFYRQRIAMPPDAVLSVRVEDVSRTDTQAPALAETLETFGDRQVPIEFALQIPNTAIDTSHSYNVRAAITVNGELRFTTTRSYPVLTRGAGNKVDLMLDAVQSDVSGQSAVTSAASPDSLVSFALPATFAGITPCADCPGIEQTLTLRSDGLYRLRRIYQDRLGGLFVELGRWTADNEQLSLNNGSETQLFQLKDDEILRQLDRLGQPIETSANLDLHRAAQVDPITESLQWRGEFRYMADAATFTDCASGIRWPVVMTGDYLATERNYLKSRNVPGAPLVVNFKGRLDLRPAMEGSPVEQIVIEKFSDSKPGTTCPSSALGKSKAIAELKDTFWKLLDLNGKKIPIAPSHKRQIRITLASEGSRLIGYSGCNQLLGTYAQKDNELRFSQMAGTMMACVSPFMELEGQVLKMLGATTGYRIEGKQLFLLKDDQVLARFEALYLR